MDKALEKEVLTRLLHSHPTGLGKEVLDNFRGAPEVAQCLQDLQQRGLVQSGKEPLEYPIKLSHAGVEAAKALEV
jgi:hypothetical protein